MIISEHLWVKAPFLSLLHNCFTVCRGSIQWLQLGNVDPEVLVSSPKWLPIFYWAWPTARANQSLHPLWVKHWVPATKHKIKAVTWACKLIGGCNLNRHTFRGIIWHISHKNEHELNCMTLLRAQLKIVLLLLLILLLLILLLNNY